MNNTLIFGKDTVNNNRSLKCTTDGRLIIDVEASNDLATETTLRQVKTAIENIDVNVGDITLGDIAVSSNDTTTHEKLDINNGLISSTNTKLDTLNTSILNKVLNKNTSSIDISGQTIAISNPGFDINNFPTTQAVSGTVAVSSLPAIAITNTGFDVNNFPATQAISGSVSVSNLPATQPVSGSVSVSNFPATQAVSGTVAVSTLPAIGITNTSFEVSNFPSTQPISGTVAVSTLPAIGITNTTFEVSNFPATQPVSGTVAVSTLPAIGITNTSFEVSNFPSTQPVSGSVSVSNFPTTQPVSGTVVVSELPAIGITNTSFGVNNFPETQAVSGTVAVSTLPTIEITNTAFEVSNFPATQSVSGSVSISNLPATQPVSGSVSISNFPTTQPVSGAVSVSSLPAINITNTSFDVSNFPATQPVSGSVSVLNLPATQAVSGSVSVSNFPATQPVSGAVSVSSLPAINITNTSFEISNLPTTQPVSGTVAVSNFPATQPVSGTVAVSSLPAIGITNTGFDVNNFPATQAISGSVSVSNLPSTQPVSGTVAISNSFTLDTTTQSTNTKLDTIHADLDGLTFDGSSNLNVNIASGSISVSSVNIKDSAGSNLTSVGGSLNNNITNSSIDVHCYASSNSNTWHHLSSDSNGQLNVHSKLQDGAGTDITSSLVSSKRALDVNVCNGIAVQIFDGTDTAEITGINSNLTGTNKGLLCNSVLYGLNMASSQTQPLTLQYNIESGRNQLTVSDFEATSLLDGITNINTDIRTNTTQAITYLTSSSTSLASINDAIGDFTTTVSLGNFLNNISINGGASSSTIDWTTRGLYKRNTILFYRDNSVSNTDSISFYCNTTSGTASPLLMGTYYPISNGTYRQLSINLNLLPFSTILIKNDSASGISGIYLTVLNG